MSAANLCELCGYAVKGYLYPLTDCNATGIGVTLHSRCGLRLQAVEAAGGSVVQVLETFKTALEIEAIHRRAPRTVEEVEKRLRGGPRRRPRIPYLRLTLVKP